jgi:uncharacterized membrane protein
MKPIGCIQEVGTPLEISLMLGVLLFLLCCLIFGLTVVFEAVFYADEQQG